MNRDCCRSKLRVLILADWTRCSRGLIWPDFLKKLAVSTECDVLRLGDQQAGLGTLWSRHSKYFIERLQNYDVLVLNWDVVNGDPEFGADYALRWFEAHWTQVTTWVFEQGGILLVEGQAVLSIPSQRSYDAIVGASELPVSGAEDDPFDLTRQRVGRECRMTEQARASAFSRLLDLRPMRPVKQVDLFPGRAGRTLTPSFLGGADWDILYRGWFRRSVGRSHRYGWVGLIRTSGRRFNHDTMRVAKYGRGAIFASTMFLASSGQVALVEAIFRMHGHTEILPVPNRIPLLVWKGIQRYVPPVLAGLTAGAITLANPNLEPALRAAVTIGAVAVFWILPRLARAIRRLRRDYMGW